MLTIKDWAEDDRPREKLVNKGITALSDAELLAILIATGTQNETAVGLAKSVLALTANNLNELGRCSIKDLQKIKGIGPAKAINIIAALELGRRRKQAEILERSSVRSSAEIAQLFQGKIADLPHEEFWILLLNSSLKIIDTQRVAQGGVGEVATDMRLIMKPAVDKLAAAIAVVHNHPSGNVQPSVQDRELTKNIAKAAAIFKIKFIDHIIVSDSAYYSFADKDGLE
ncbi:MAG: DNA repair protein RadC [Prevotellaceae bacterium]|jgi:DNA repair protein RadC|nr:DNA repair protein RadC [Prevotellaceae bacterium]